MELLCPECRGELVSPDGKVARCTVHGGQYDILFLRSPTPQSSVPTAPGGDGSAPTGMCVHHPEVQASFVCASCGQSICDLCAFTREDGSRACAQCATSPVANNGAAPPIIGVGDAPPIPGAAGALPANAHGLKCLQHPDVAAVQVCKSCGAPICATCDFLLPGNIHLCPRCVAAPPKQMSGGRKKLLIAAYALAGWNTLALAAFMAASVAGIFESKQQEAALGTLYSLFVFMPSLIGLGLSVGCLDRRLRNPGAVWGVIIWNGAFLVLHLIFVVIGSLKG